MSSDQYFLELIEKTSTTRTYKREHPAGRPINVIVNVSEEELKVYSPEIRNFHPFIFNLSTYYPKKSLEEKMERAVIEYIGLLTDIGSPGD